MQFEAAQPASDVHKILKLLEATRSVARGRSDRCDRMIPVFNALRAAGRRGLTQVQLAGALGIPPARMSRLIDLLEPQGFIGRHDHPLDRRSKVIQLTTLGLERLAAYEADARARSDKAFGKLSPTEILSLKTILARLVG